MASLSPEQQRALLAELLKRRAQNEPSASGSVRFPMSAGQQGLWYAFRRDPKATQFNVFLTTRIRSPISAAALQQAIEFLVQRHACLRTTFSDAEGRTTQQIHEKLLPEFRVVAAQQFSSKDREDELRAIVAAETQRPFDLERGPLLRVALYQLAPDDWIVLATTHHIVVDFWSLILMLAELRESYPSFEAGRVPELKSIDNNYAEFVRDQATTLLTPRGKELKQYWSSQLEGAPTVLDLITDFDRPAAFTGQAAVVPIHIAKNVASRLQPFAASQRVTPFSVVQSALQVLLSRYSGQKEFLIGFPASGRRHHKYEKTVGFFVNMLPMRANLIGDPTFEELVSRTSQTLLDALEHEEYPFSHIIHDVAPVRDPSRSPLFQVSCTYEKAQLREEVGRASFLFPTNDNRTLDIGGLQQEGFYVPHQTCHYDIEFIFEQTHDGLRGMICYCSDLYAEDSMRALAKNYADLLAMLLDEPKMSVFGNRSEKPIATISQADPKVPPVTVSAHWPSIPHLYVALDSTFSKFADRPALRAGERRWTYRQLQDEIQSNQAQITFPSSHSERIIPVSGRNSPETLVAILSVIYSGSAVVPLDSLQPSVSHSDLFQDLGSKLIVEAPLTKSKSDPQGRPIKQIRSYRGDELAYVIYTSGSTGRPKGVMVEHQAIANTLSWRTRQLKLGADDRVLIMLSHQFDAGFALMMHALVQGAELVWRDDGAEHDLELLMQQMIRDRITVFSGIPSIVRMLIDHTKYAELNLRQYWIGGESMPPDLPARVTAATRKDDREKVELWNLYGPTEAAVEATAFRVSSNHDLRRAIPIGRAIDGAEVFILDDRRQCVSKGVPGEIAIGGRGLARGYLNREQLTRERFIEILTPAGSRRVYLTGDRGRQLPDGNFEFLGRFDHQVKVRGYRLEIEEIESHLRAHAWVKAAAAKVVHPNSAAASLVGYVTLSESVAAEVLTDTQAIAIQIRHDLLSSLPAYKVPSQLVVLAELPTTLSGKVDRQRLPEVAIDQSNQPLALPETPFEEYLASAWKNELNLTHVGVQQNFFELGGSSLQAALLTSKLTADLGFHIPTSLIFDLADITQIAQRLVQLQEIKIAERFGPESVTHYAHRSGPLLTTSDLHPLLAPLKITGDRPPIFMIHPPGGIVICYRELAEQLDEQQPLYAIRSRGLHGDEQLPATLQEAAADYAEAIKSIQPQGPYTVGGWSIGGIFALELAQQLLAAGDEVDRLIMLDTTIPEGSTSLVPATEQVNVGLEYGIDMSLKQLLDLPAHEQLPFLWQHAKNLGVLKVDSPPAVIEQLIRDLKRLFRHHIDLANQYTLGPYAGRIVLIRPKNVPVELKVTLDRGWRCIANEVDVKFVSGHHHSMVQSPQVAELAALIS